MATSLLIVGIIAGMLGGLAVYFLVLYIQEKNDKKNLQIRYAHKCKMHKEATDAYEESQKNWLDAKVLMATMVQEHARDAEEIKQMTNIVTEEAVKLMASNLELHINNSSLRNKIKKALIENKIIKSEAAKLHELAMESANHYHNLITTQRKLKDTENDLAVSNSLSNSRRISMNKMSHKIKYMKAHGTLGTIDRLIAMDKAGKEFIEEVKNHMGAKEIDDFYAHELGKRVKDIKNRLSEIKELMKGNYWPDDLRRLTIAIIDKEY